VFEALNVEMRFLMLAEDCTLGISLPFFLESLCGAVIGLCTCFGLVCLC